MVYVRGCVVSRRKAALSIHLLGAVDMLRCSRAFPRDHVMDQRLDLVLEPHKTCDHGFHPSLNILDVRFVLNRDVKVASMFFAALKSKVW